jgi:hypothetical protein
LAEGERFFLFFCDLIQIFTTHIPVMNKGCERGKTDYAFLKYEIKFDGFVKSPSTGLRLSAPACVANADRSGARGRQAVKPRLGAEVATL